MSGIGDFYDRVFNSSAHSARGEYVAEGYSGESLGRWRQAMNGLDTDPGRKAQRSTGLD